ncbi:MAG TPA: hypothetical protein VEF34_12605 [Syntrophobacteraceae bacterium]|nr:hypothetical protein [Syntrophobacteraceae bacterium]
MKNRNEKQLPLWGNELKADQNPQNKTRRGQTKKPQGLLPVNFGKAIRLPVPDFSDSNRKLTCLESDFPIAQINALSNLEGNAGKPIYQVSKWWARRRSSVFRSMLIAAATEAPDDPNEAAKLVLDHYYCNHQKAGSFKSLRVLDCFMGGGTTLVEGSRLGMQMTGVDLNPVAWFVVKNELACSDPEQVKALFDHIESEVRPQIQPFYTTTCPRGHRGHWVDVQSGEPVTVDPADLLPEARSSYRWNGPEVIYTFWAKHGPCQARGCGHRTPIFKNPIIAEKKLTAYLIPTICPSCGLSFNVELGETRMAPSVERVVLDSEPPFTELSQPFATHLKQYSQGAPSGKRERVLILLDMVAEETGLFCPKCGRFAGNMIKAILERHARAGRIAALKKKDFGIEKRPVFMYLLINPKWLFGTNGVESEGELGGYAGATVESTSHWYERRLSALGLVEVRGRIRLSEEEIAEDEDDEFHAAEELGGEDEAAEEKDRKKYGLPREIVLADGTIIQTRVGTLPRKAHFICASCGREDNTLESVRSSAHTGPVAAYALQCYCPQCETEGYNYDGRYFKALDIGDIRHLNAALHEWEERRENDLKEFWPLQEMQYSHMTHERNPLPDHGYTHWWMLFNERQLLVHSLLLKSISEAAEDQWSLDVREQALGVFQQYLRNQNMFSIWNIQRDTPEPFFSEGNYNPKHLVIENSVFTKLGRGNWQSSSDKCLGALKWVKNPWERAEAVEAVSTKSITVSTEDPVIPGTEVCCGSSTDLAFLHQTKFDLVITDPPFGNNYYYADLADFFYVWLRIPLLQWSAGTSEHKYFSPERTPHNMEAIDNPAEHPDDRGDHEKSSFVETKHLAQIRELSGDRALKEKDQNPVFRPQPSTDFYRQTLSACWAEAGRLLKDGGIMAFTFHHSDDQAWVDVLEALFNAGFLLLQTFPVIGDESKGESGQFGSKKIEYDIIHVCRKRLREAEPVSWARMRRWVKDETVRLKELLEHTHGKSLPESDLRVILRGKALEFYSRHYGQVFTGDGQLLNVRDALLGINQLLDDLLDEASQIGDLRPPDSAEPASRLFLRLFKNRSEMDRDELHKTLRGTGISQGDLEARGWVRVIGKTVHVVPVRERFAYFTERGRNRKVIKTDLDQAYFLVGAAFPNSGLKIETELNNQNFQIKRSVDDILKWVAQVDPIVSNRIAANTAAQLVEHWRTRRGKPEFRQLTFFERLEDE